MFPQSRSNTLATWKLELWNSTLVGGAFKHQNPALLNPWLPFRSQDGQMKENNCTFGLTKVSKPRHWKELGRRRDLLDYHGIGKGRRIWPLTGHFTP